MIWWNKRYINNYNEYLTWKKRIEKENNGETKQRREIEKLDAELKYKEKLHSEY